MGLRHCINEMSVGLMFYNDTSGGRIRIGWLSMGSERGMWSVSSVWSVHTVRECSALMKCGGHHWLGVWNQYDVAMTSIITAFQSIDTAHSIFDLTMTHTLLGLQF